MEKQILASINHWQTTIPYGIWYLRLIAFGVPQSYVSFFHIRRFNHSEARYRYYSFMMAVELRLLCDILGASKEVFFFNFTSDEARRFKVRCTSWSEHYLNKRLSISFWRLNIRMRVFITRILYDKKGNMPNRSRSRVVDRYIQNQGPFITLEANSGSTNIGARFLPSSSRPGAVSHGKSHA